MLDYKDIINKHYALNMSGREIARETGVSKSEVNGFLTAFAQCKTLSFPLPKGITNQGIAEAVYGKNSEEGFRDKSYELPDFVEIDRQMRSRKNMTLSFLWNQYRRKCEASGNALERVNEEIRRRTKVVGIFPSDKSYIRLVTTYLIEYTENWLEGSCYVKADLLKQQNEDLPKAA